MFAWYTRCIKEPRGRFVYQMCNVLHYRLLSRSPTTSTSTPGPELPHSTPVPAATSTPGPELPHSTHVPATSTSTPGPELPHPMPMPVRESRPVTLREKADNDHHCEWCGQNTCCRTKVLLPVIDIDEPHDGKCYATFCDRTCFGQYHKWCKELVPGLPHRYQYPGDHPDMIRTTFKGMYVPGDGDALHDKWSVQYVLLKEGRRTGMVLTPRDYNGFYDSVKWGGERCTPSIFVSLHDLRKWFPVPTPAPTPTLAPAPAQ
jgi:hypothetical protein